MDVHEFHKDFFEEIKATASTDGEGSSTAFVSVATSYLLNSDVLTDFNFAFYSGNGKNSRKLRVDGYVLDDFDLTLNLIIADYTGDITRSTVTKNFVSTMFDRVVYFLEEAIEGSLHQRVEPSTPVSDLIDTIRFNKDRIRKYRILVLTDGFMSNRINEIDSRKYRDVPVECQIWDIDRIYRVCNSNLGRQNIEIDFTVYTDGQGIPCLEASNANNDDFKSYLCIIPGVTLAEIYDRYGSQLLEGNVRSFLSTKVAVNKKIRETILRVPQNFFAYNNGISATAMELKFKDTDKGRMIVYAKDFQVINGGQTTASLSSSRYRDNADLNQIFVQMKLTEIDSKAERASELIRNISRSSNSQNKVSDADFFATHPFHVRMEQISRRTYAPATGGAQYETKWFYERARGQFFQSQMNMTKSQKDKFLIQNPKKQMISKTDLAKYRNSWSGLPHIVSKGAQTNFMRFAEIIDENWLKSDVKFNDKYFKDSVSLALLFKHTERIVSHQPWFEQGYRANIVTYSIALLHRLIRLQFADNDLDLQLIWNRQQIPDIITNELIAITEFVFKTITNPNRGTINVTQWCKRDACWEDVKKCPLSLSPEFRRVLIGKEEIKVDEREANRDQKFVSEIEAQKRVLEMGADFWKEIEAFTKRKKLNVSPEQLKSLKYAVKIPFSIPSAYQSLLLLSLLEEAQINGFKFKGEEQSDGKI